MTYWVQTEAAALEHLFFKDPNRFYQFAGTTGHDFERHVDTTLVSCLDRLFIERKRAVSMFLSEEHYRIAWENAILDNTSEIVIWRANSAQKTLELKTRNNFEDDIVGEGFIFDKGRVKHVISNNAKIILKKSYNPYNQVGFEVVTAYADLSQTKRKETEKDLIPILYKTNIWKTSTAAQQKRLQNIILTEKQRQLLTAVNSLYENNEDIL